MMESPDLLNVMRRIDVRLRNVDVALYMISTTLKRIADSLESQK